MIRSVKKFIAQYISRKTISSEDLTIFFKQFATLITAGIPLTKCCDILEKSQVNSLLRLVIYSIKRNILTGHHLYYCLRQHPQYFDELTCQLIKVGEHTGKLDTMLLMISQHLEKNLAFKKRLKQALFYPLIVTAIAFIISFCMMYFIIPRFAELFQESHAKIPALTHFIFSISAFMHHTLWLFLLAPLASFILLTNSKHTQHIKQFLYHHTTSLPIIKPFLQKVMLARFARNLSIALTAGLPLTDALTLASHTTTQNTLTRHLTQLRLKIIAGQQIHLAMQTLPDFPALMIQMIKIGEESGTLESMLAKIADFFEADIDQLLSRLGELLEPLIMILLGVLIGGLVIGLYLPIFTLGSAL